MPGLSHLFVSDSTSSCTSFVSDPYDYLNFQSVKECFGRNELFFLIFGVLFFLLNLYLSILYILLCRKLPIFPKGKKRRRENTSQVRQSQWMNPLVFDLPLGQRQEKGRKYKGSLVILGKEEEKIMLLILELLKKFSVSLVYIPF